MEELEVYSKYVWGVQPGAVVTKVWIQAAYFFNTFVGCKEADVGQRRYISNFVALKIPIKIMSIAEEQWFCTISDRARQSLFPLDHKISLVKKESTNHHNKTEDSKTETWGNIYNIYIDYQQKLSMHSPACVHADKWWCHHKREVHQRDIRRKWSFISCTVISTSLLCHSACWLVFCKTDKRQVALRTSICKMSSFSALKQ